MELIKYINTSIFIKTVHNYLSGITTFDEQLRKTMMSFIELTYMHY